MSICDVFTPTHIDHLRVIREIALGLTIVHAAMFFFYEAWRTVSRKSRRWVGRIVVSLVLITVYLPICAAPAIVYTFDLYDVTGFNNTTNSPTCDVPPNYEPENQAQEV
jgi:hypothetical protein